MPILKQTQTAGAMKDAVVLDLGDLGRQAARLRMQAEAQAANIITDAEKKAAQLVENASGQGFEQGRAEGLEQGTREGLEQGRAHEGLEALELHADRGPAHVQLAAGGGDPALLDDDPEVVQVVVVEPLHGRILRRSYRR